MHHRTGTWLRRLDHPLSVVLLIAAAYAAYLGLRWHRFGGDWSRFICAGDEFCDPDRVPAGVFVRPRSSGYDGQFYYRLALDPFSRRPSDFGIRLDAPAYRHQRIVYPLLAWLVSGGNPQHVPAALVALNFAGLLVFAALAALWARIVGQHALWGLLIALYPGFVATFARDLTEILQSCFLLSTLLCLHRGRITYATVLLALAVLTRETALGLVLGIGLYIAEQSVRGRRAALRFWPAFVLPTGVYLAWQSALRWWWGEWPLTGGAGTLGRPLGGLSTFVSQLGGHPGNLAGAWLAQLVLLGLVTIAVLWTWRRASTLPAVRAAWVLYALLAAVLTTKIWVDDWAFLRALTEFYVLGAAILIAAAGRLRFLVLTLLPLAWLIAARTHRPG
jgi:hypothetical protein